MNILLAGEQWTSVGVEVKGFDYFGVSSYHEGSRWLIEALQSHDHHVDHLRSFDVPRMFPEQLEQLSQYDVLILSDIGSNSLLFHPEVLVQSICHPNRLKLIRDYVAQGGGLLMIGGWMSFQGIDGRARYHRTPIEEVLPVLCEPNDDRVECPEGITPEVVNAAHPVLAGITGRWPVFLGYNLTTLKPEAESLVTIEGDPFIATQRYGKGRTAAFTSDCAPHWGPPEFLEWPYYGLLWHNLVEWLGDHSHS